MSDNDSDFDDFRMDDQDHDELVEPLNEGGDQDNDEDDAYDLPEEDDNDEDDSELDAGDAHVKTESANGVDKKKTVSSATASGTSSKRAHNPQDPEGTEAKGAKDLEEAYVMRNNVAYLVGQFPEQDGPGRVRDHGNVIVVEDDHQLGSMHLPKNWPAAREFPPTAICVLKAKHTAEDKLLPDKEKGPFGWYARVVTKQDVGKTPRKSANNKILKLIPKKVVQSIVKYLGSHQVYRRSTLIEFYQPTFENAKAFRVDINGWKRSPGIKSTGITPKKEAKDIASPVKNGEPATAASDEEDLENEPEVKLQKHDKESPSAKAKHSFKGKAPAPSEVASEKTKASEMASATASVSGSGKKPISLLKKGGMLNFAKSTKNATETAPEPKAEPQAISEKVAAAHSAATSKDATPEDKPAKATKESMDKPLERGTSGSSSGQKRPVTDGDDAFETKDVRFKRTRMLVVDDVDKSFTFWKGNTLYIAEL